jgi:phosphopantetheinyl transferase
MHTRGNNCPLRTSTKYFDDENRPMLRKIHILPRTKEGKPYITLVEKEKSATTTLPFSVSHQHPVVGVAFLDYTNNPYYNMLDTKSNISTLIGMDIVIFGYYFDDCKHLYSSQDEFLSVFKDYFTPKEWAHIQNAATTDCSVKEFFLRWSMKEAYTKAIGKGMMTHFHSFEITITTFFGKQEGEDEEVISLSDVVLSKRETSYFQGRIQKKLDVIDDDDDNGIDETMDWSFAFIPWHSFEGEDAKEMPSTTASGCVCICAARTHMSMPCAISSVVNISSCSLNDLIRFHNSSPE